MGMERWRNRVAVVTGASSGIGAATVVDLVKAGMIVVGLARRKDRVEELKTKIPEELRSNLHAVRCDVSDVQSVNEAFDWIEQTLGGVDVLVNNAGIVETGQLCTLDVTKMQQVMNVNVMGVIHCTQRAYKSLKERDVEGHVVNVNSDMGHAINSAGHLPQVNIYPPSKYALTAITEMLRQEFRGLKTKIKITSVSPGATNTEIIPDWCKDIPMLRPEDVSDAILYAIGTPQHVQMYEMMIRPQEEMY